VGVALLALALLIALALVQSDPGTAASAPGSLSSIPARPLKVVDQAKLKVGAIVRKQRRRNRLHPPRPHRHLRPKPEPGEGKPAGGGGGGVRPDVGPKVAEGVNGAEGKPAEEEGDKGPRPRFLAPAHLQAPQRTPALRSGGPHQPFAAATSFLAAQSSESGFVPPDSMGSVGPSQILIYVNGRIKLFDKAGNPQAGLNMTDATFWSSVTGGSDVSDPGVEYDRLSGRWIVSAITIDSPNKLVLAISSGPTITAASSFSLYAFSNGLAGNKFADYPQLGVDKNGVYIGTNDFIGNSFKGTAGYVFSKAALISGSPSAFVFEGLATGTGSGPYSPQGVTDMDANVNDGYFIGVDNAAFSQLDLRRVSNVNGPGPPTLSGNLNVAVPTTYFPLTVPAQGTANGLDAIDDRLYEAMIARNPDGSLALWTAHNIRVNSSGAGGSSGSFNRDADRWYEIGSLGTTPALIQSGTLFDSAASSPIFYWMPSIAANGQGHASLNSSAAGVGRFTDIVSAGHLAGDPAGTTQAPTTVVTGSSIYNPLITNPERWGDYSQTVVDPTDNQTFWTFQEYANAPSSWGLQVTQLKAPPPATPASSSPASVSAGQQSVCVQITGTSSAGSGFFDPGSDFGGPGYASHISGSATGGVTVKSVSFIDPTHVTLDLDTTGASAGTQSLTITNPDGQSATGPALDVGSGGSPCTGPTAVTGAASDIGPDTATVSATVNPHGIATTFRFQYGTTTAYGLDSPAPPASAGAGNSDVGVSTSLAGLAPSTTYHYLVDASSSAGTAEGDDATFTTTASPSGGGGSSAGGGGSTDTTPPDTTITRGPKRKTSKTSARFRFRSSEPGSSFRCRLDRKPFAACSSPKRYTHLKPGRHRFRVFAADSAGNRDPSAVVYKWKVTP
jgi:hypothetical protein